MLPTVSFNTMRKFSACAAMSGNPRPEVLRCDCQCMHTHAYVEERDALVQPLIHIAQRRHILRGNLLLILGRRKVIREPAAREARSALDDARGASNGSHVWTANYAFGARIMKDAHTHLAGNIGWNTISFDPSFAKQFVALVPPTLCSHMSSPNHSQTHWTLTRNHHSRKAPYFPSRPVSRTRCTRGQRNRMGPIHSAAVCTTDNLEKACTYGLLMIPVRSCNRLRNLVLRENKLQPVEIRLVRITW